MLLQLRTETLLFTNHFTELEIDVLNKPAGRSEDVIIGVGVSNGEAETGTTG